MIRSKNWFILAVDPSDDIGTIERKKLQMFILFALVDAIHNLKTFNTTVFYVEVD